MRESINFDRIADRYDATRGGEGRGRRLGADLACHLRAACPVVEIGIGTGVVALALRDLAFGVRGLDISAEMLARARERVGNVVVRGDATQLPLRSSCIHQAYSVWVLHLVADVRRVMDEMVRVLRPGGRYFVMDGRGYDEPQNAIDEIWMELESALGRSVPARRVLGFAEHAKDAGLSVVEVVPTGPYPVLVTATTAADNIESRAHSWTWSIPDGEWEPAARKAVAKLRALPNADEPVTRNDFQEILVLER
jgi:ubiquinone/menaquinone biosynthesis C-methylase UbiE